MPLGLRPHCWFQMIEFPVCLAVSWHVGFAQQCLEFTRRAQFDDTGIEALDEVLRCLIVPTQECIFVNIEGLFWVVVGQGLLLFLGPKPHVRHKGQKGSNASCIKFLDILVIVGHRLQLDGVGFRLGAVGNAIANADGLAFERIQAGVGPFPSLGKYIYFCLFAKLVLI